MRIVPTLIVASLLATSCSGLRNVPPGERRAIVVSLDGGAERVIERMLAAGAMPNLARLTARGAWMDYSVTNYPSKTAAGHAALWTGAFSDANGVTCNKVFTLPLHAHSILDVEDGFDSRALLAEPIWVTAARAGKRVTVLQATHASPMSVYEPGGRFGGPFQGSLTLLDGFDGPKAKDGLFRGARNWRPASGWTQAPAGGEPMEMRLALPDRTWWALAYDDPADPVAGYDTVALAPQKAAAPVVLKPGGWTPGLRVDTDKGPAYLQFHLYALDPKLDDWMLYHTPATRAASNKREAADTWYGAETPFMPQGPGRLWATGEFGPTLFQGGDGTAERHYRAVVGRLTALARKRLERLIARRDWDLGLYYVPFPDEALHHWYGAADDASPGYDPAVAPKVWEHLTAICRQVDDVLAPLAEHEDLVTAVAADHGMGGTRWSFHANHVLEKAGLLVLRRDGKVDLARTKALYPATDGAFVVVNQRGRKGGIVAPADVPRVLDQVEAAFRAVKAHDGSPLVPAMLRAATPEAAALGIGGPRAGDLYLDLKPGYYFDGKLGSKALFSPQDAGRAGHVFDPRRPDMHAVMMFAGPGVRRGVTLGPARNADLAPTVCKLLGIPAPAQATGRALTEALAAQE